MQMVEILSSNVTTSNVGLFWCMTAITVTCPFLLQQWLVWMTVGIEGKSLLSSNFETEQNFKKTFN